MSFNLTKKLQPDFPTTNSETIIVTKGYNNPLTIYCNDCDKYERCKCGIPARGRNSSAVNSNINLLTETSISCTFHTAYTYVCGQCDYWLGKDKHCQNCKIIHARTTLMCLLCRTKVCQC